MDCNKSFIQNYDDVFYKFEALQDELTNEELEYYLKVLNRVERLY